MSADPAFAVVDGRVVPVADARVHALSAGMKYGAAVFEGLRAYWNAQSRVQYVFRLHDHLRRLVQSMRLMRFETALDVAQLEAQVVECLAANRLARDVHMRAMAYVAGQGGMDATGPVSVIVTAQARPQPKAAETGLKLCVSSWTRISDAVLPPRIKCNANYANGRLASLEARERGLDDAILLTARGTVAECPGACIVMVRDGRPATPSRTSGILESITRDTVMTMLREDLGLETERREIDRTELYAADEVFLCGTAQEIRPAIAIDGLAIGAGAPGPVVRALKARYAALARGEAPDHPEWRFPVAIPR